MTHVTVQGRVADQGHSVPSPDPLVPTVFHEPWWLDIVTGRQWQDAEVREDGRLIGRMPYQTVRRFGGPVIDMPPLTHFLGPAIDDGTGSRQARWLKRSAVTRDLIQALPPSASFWQKFHRGVTDVVAFQAEQFDTAVQFTFEVTPAPEEVLWAGLRDKHRNVIRKARRQFEIEELDDSDEFAQFYTQNLQERGQENWTSRSLMRDLVAAAVGRGAGRLLGLRDAENRLSAAVFCPSDRQASYYTLSTRRPDSGNGAIPLLIWEAIRRAARSGLLFDFDGLATESAIGLYAGFGGVTSPRYVSIRSPRTRMIRLVRRTCGLKTNPFGS